ncbi:nitrate reductase [Lacimicrobium alkaliphilum]|uniref:Nitrate reductase n=1 Tax=Lacimicrobium alkaliphilum TaxID=1526571 RepID=A0A0U3AZE3_9ALTE|nr:nitrate reductase [Lacimicrobium alkaliphilum]ALS98344.1 nitrate reductase [Lacimicrobium alkaliphilum]
MTGPTVIATTCPYCGVGCGVDVRISKSGEEVALQNVSGSPEHPANHGRLCIKGSKLAQTQQSQSRLLSPVMDGEEVSWQQAISAVAQGLKHSIAEHGADSVAFYVSGQLLSEDYYVANKLLKGYIGSANIDTNSRLCMSSAVSGYKRAFGADAVPCCYEDLEQTDLLILTGSNAAWTHPVLYQRIERAKAIRPQMKVVVIDPRRTASCESGDLHLALKPGTDVALFNGLLAFLDQHNALDKAYIQAHTSGFESCLDKASDWSVATVAEYCDLAEADVLAFYRCFAASDRAVTAFCMGVNQSSSGTDKVNAIINCHLASGKIGRPGCGPFSLTGQPNAMGGREVGGLATMLAAHLEFQNPEHRDWLQGFWQSPAMAQKPGLTATELVSAMESGQIKALWIMGTNPLVSLPDRSRVERALNNCPLVVVSEVAASNDTLKYAHISLPARPWAEKDGTVTNSERRISRQRAVLPPTGQAKADWQIISQVAQAMGFNGFDYTSPAQIFVEHAQLTALHNQGSRALDLSALTELTEQQYQQLEPVQWPVNSNYPQGCKRLFTDGKFFTDNERARFIALEVREPKQRCSTDFPFVLNSGRIRDQWHTMTRTGNCAELMAHQHSPFVAMHPLDAADLGIEAGQLMVLSSALSNGKVILELQLTQDQRRGELYAPMHWNNEFCSHGSIAHLYRADCDPHSMQPELKHAAVNLSRADFGAYGLLLSRQPLAVPALQKLADYWLKIPLAEGVCYQLASVSDSPKWHQAMAALLPTEQQLASHGQALNCLALDQQRLSWALFTDPTGPIELPLDWLNTELGNQTCDSEALSALLRRSPRQSQGRQICSCFGIGEQAILAAISEGHDSIGKLGQQLGCGTGCGSCKAELSALIDSSARPSVDPDKIIIQEAV